LFAFLENGIGRIRIQVILGLLMAVVNLVLSVLWVQQFEVIGVIAATVVAYGAVVAWVIPLDVYWILHKKGAQV
jgi:O-antigen/teichoic acid export membrane protein